MALAAFSQMWVTQEENLILLLGMMAWVYLKYCPGRHTVWFQLRIIKKKFESIQQRLSEKIAALSYLLSFQFLIW